jgi:uncharacterized protein YggE
LLCQLLLAQRDTETAADQTDADNANVFKHFQGSGFRVQDLGTANQTLNPEP